MILRVHLTAHHARAERSAIASAIADSRASIHAEPRATLSTNKPKLISAVSAPSMRTSRAVSRCNRVGVSSNW